MTLAKGAQHAEQGGGAFSSFTTFGSLGWRRIFLEPRQLLRFSQIKRKVVLTGLGRCGQPCMTRVSPAVHGAASAPPTHATPEFRAGAADVERGRQLGLLASWDTLRLGPPFAAACADLAVNFYLLSKMSIRGEGETCS